MGEAWRFPVDHRSCRLGGHISGAETGPSRGDDQSAPLSEIRERCGQVLELIGHDDMIGHIESGLGEQPSHQTTGLVVTGPGGYAGAGGDHGSIGRHVRLWAARRGCRPTAGSRAPARSRTEAE